MGIDPLQIRPEDSFEAETAIENRRLLSWMGDPRGKRILDLGCGLGDAAVYLALKGALVTAVDISPGMVAVCRRLAELRGVGDRVEVRVAVGEGLPFEDQSFDIVYGNGVLHHLDLEHAGPEIARVLKPGGLGLFIEPLSYNPVIQIYRFLAMGVRTKSEAALRYKDFRRFARSFESLRLEEMQLLTLAIFLWFFFVEALNPSKVRYWKRLVQEGKRYASAFRVLRSLEIKLMKFLPFLRPLCWNVTLRVQKSAR